MRHSELVKLKIKEMSKDELMDFLTYMEKYYKIGFDKPIEMIDEYIKFIDSLPNGDASSVSTNEQAKEVCSECGSEKYIIYNCTNRDCICHIP